MSYFEMLEKVAQQVPGLAMEVKVKRHDVIVPSNTPTPSGVVSCSDGGAQYSDVGCILASRFLTSIECISFADGRSNSLL